MLPVSQSNRQLASRPCGRLWRGKQGFFLVTVAWVDRRIRRDSLVSSYTLGSLIIQNIVMPSPPSTKLPVLSVLPSPIWICSISRKPRCSYTSRECLVVASNQTGTPSSAAFWRYGSTKARIMPAFETIPS